MYYDYGYDISQYARGVDSTSTGVLLGFLGAFAILWILLGLIVLVLQIIGFWKIFNKAGEKGWKSIIPIYNLVVLYRICGLSPWLLLIYLLGWIPFIGWIACLVLTIYQANCLAKSFNKDIGYTVGLILLSPIFYMILGFSKEITYAGPAAKKVTEVTTEPDVEQKKEEKTEE